MHPWEEEANCVIHSTVSFALIDGGVGSCTLSERKNSRLLRM